MNDWLCAPAALTPRNRPPTEQEPEWDSANLNALEKR